MAKRKKSSFKFWFLVVLGIGILLGLFFIFKDRVLNTPQLSKSQVLGVDITSGTKTGKSKISGINYTITAQITNLPVRAGGSVAIKGKITKSTSDGEIPVSGGDVLAYIHPLTDNSKLYHASPFAHTNASGEYIFPATTVYSTDTTSGTGARLNLEVGKTYLVHVYLGGEAPGPDLTFTVQAANTDIGSDQLLTNLKNEPVTQSDIFDPNQPAGVKELQALIQRLLNVGVALAFIALTGVLVWAGIKFLTSGGDQKQIQSAYDMITWAVLGIFFLAIAWLIILLIENFTGVKVTQFCIGFDCQ